jgi:hypothetical protein
VDGISEEFVERRGRRDVVRDTTIGDSLTRLEFLQRMNKVLCSFVKQKTKFAHPPPTEDVDEDVVREAAIEELGEEVEVGDKGSLKDDGDVRGVEQLDAVCLAATALLLVFHGEFHAETLRAIQINASFK